MSRIDELTQELCPQGVEHKTLGQVGEFIRGNGLQKADLRDKGVPAVHYGQIHTFYGVHATQTRSFTDPEIAAKLRHAQPGDLLIATTSEDDDAVAKATAWLGDTDVVLSSDAYIYRHELDPKYVAYFFQSTSFQDQKRRFISGTKVRRVSGASLEKMRIPVPPLEVQREIVQVLDRFTQLEAELEAELEARRNQYEHYLSSLFESLPEGTPLKTFTEVGVFSRGGGPQKKDFIDSGVGCIHYGQIYTHYGVSATVTNKFVSAAVAARAKGASPGDVVIAVTSENDDDLARSVAWLGSDWVAVSNHTLIFTSEMDPRFVSYYLRSRRFDSAKRKYISGTKVKSLPLRAFENIQIPVPPMVEQVRLANLLDKFDALVNSISVGLPAELAARRKQYEHYLDRLLTFKELAS